MDIYMNLDLRCANNYNNKKTTTIVSPTTWHILQSILELLHCAAPDYSSGLALFQGREDLRGWDPLTGNKWTITPRNKQMSNTQNKKMK